MRSNINLYHGDCMDAMAEMQDNQYDLAIVDPPYGIGAGNMEMGKGKNKKWKKGVWDSNTPIDLFFIEVIRVSVNQIIWGGNYFKLPCARGWVFWDKGLNGKSSFADGELAWTSFDRVLRKANIRYDGFLGADKQRIHPTQKPIALYKWLLTNYATEGDKILDTHGGSMSIALACWDLKFDLDLWELDEDYYKAGCKRFNDYVMQLQFDF